MNQSITMGAATVQLHRNKDHLDCSSINSLSIRTMSKGIAVKTALSLAMQPHDMTAVADDDDVITSLKRNVKSSNEYISCISYIHRSIDTVIMC